MLASEPALDPQIQRCFRVPDASANAFLAAELNAESARQHGAEILRYHQVVRLLLSTQPSTDEGARVVGVLCRDFN